MFAEVEIASGTDAQPGYEVAVLSRGLGKFHQQAFSRRYYLGTACQIVKSNIFRQYMAETNRQLLTTSFTNGKITT